jgi:hypothetical protein
VAVLDSVLQVIAPGKIVQALHKTIIWGGGGCMNIAVLFNTEIDVIMKMGGGLLP